MPETEFFRQISNLSTEQLNPATRNIDVASTEEILSLINEQDKLVALAVNQEIPQIAEAVEHIVSRFKLGGRLFYVGAGTSGRLGIVDAAECPPTFGSSPDLVQAIIAGGKEAVFQAQEGAEDSFENGVSVISNFGITSKDIVCGIAASGRTPFVLGALAEAKSKDIFSILITTVSKEQITKSNLQVDVLIAPQVGPEVIAGSTRMKSGTAQKLVLNMLTTATMVRLGKTLSNIMIDLQLTNAKLVERSKRIIMMVSDVNYDEATYYLKESKGKVKLALVMSLGKIDAETALKKLEEADGFVSKAVNFDYEAFINRIEKGI